MEGGGEDVALAQEERLVMVAGDDLNAGTGIEEAGSTDENGFHGGGAESRLEGGEDCSGTDRALELASVSVADDGDIEEAEGVLGGGADAGGEQYGAGAGGEGGALKDERAQTGGETAVGEELEHGGTLAAWEHDAVKRVEGVRGADLDRITAGRAESTRVGGKITLEGEHSDFRHSDYQPRVCSC